MPEPTLAELPQPTFVTVSDTPIYLKAPIKTETGEISSLTIKSDRGRGTEGIDNAVLLVRQQSRRRGEEDFLKPLDNVNDYEQIDWDKVGGLTYKDAQGQEVILTKDQLSLTPQEEPQPAQSHATTEPSAEPMTPPLAVASEPKAARSVLEGLTTPPSLTIVGLKAYEARAHDLAAKSMEMPRSPHERAHYEGFKEFWEQTKDSLKTVRDIKRTIWKHSLGHTYFQEKSRQYYMDMLREAQSPFAQESIRAAETAGQKRYDELLKNSNVLSKSGTRFVEYIKSNLGMRTMVQRFALEEIGAMREAGQIKELATFERESAAVRTRFEQDFDQQDTFIRKKLGEKLDILDPESAEHKPIVDGMRSLVRRFATGEIATKAEFETEVNTFYSTHLKSARPDVFQQAELYSSSLFDVAETLKTRASHDGGLANIDQQINAMQVRLGMGVMGEATQLEPTLVKRGTDSIQKTLTWLEKKGIVSPFGLNEVTISSGVALALSLAVIPKSLATSRLIGAGVAGSAAGAVFGGFREYGQLQREYLTHLREREAGLTFAPESKRRAWMEKYFLSQRNSDELMAALSREANTPDEIRAKVASLADAKARKDLGSRSEHRYGLIQYSGLENIESQRTALDIAVSQTEKDLLSTGKVEAQFLKDLTAAQTRVLTEGTRAMEGLDDEMKRTLGLLSGYNPEIDIVRRRFPLLGTEYKTGNKATGMDEILTEFKRAAVESSIKRGLEVGVYGALIGAGLREGLHLGFEGASRLAEHVPPLKPEELIGGRHFQMSQNLRFDGDNLYHIDQDSGRIIDTDTIKDLGDHLKTANAYNADGSFSQATHEFITKQGDAMHLKFGFPEPIHTPVEFSGTHLLPNITGQPIQAPSELHWAYEGHGRQLLLEAKDGTQHLIYADELGRNEPSGALEAIKNSHFFKYTEGSEHREVLVPHTVEHISPITHDGGKYIVEAQIPTGMRLEHSTGNLYTLVDDKGNELLHKIQIDDHGQILNYPEEEAHLHGLTLRDQLDQTLTITSETENSGTFPKIVGEMGEERGFHGPWGWLEDPINSSSEIDHNLPATNLAKNLFRGTYENYYDLSADPHKYVTGDFKWDEIGHKVNYNAMQANTTFHEVPEALFRDPQLVKLGGIMDHAIQLKEIDHVNLAHSFSQLKPEELAALHTLGLTKEDDYQILQAAYAIGREGRVATADEVKMFIEYMGGGSEKSTIEVFHPIIEQTIKNPGLIEGKNGEIVTNIITLAEKPVTPEIPLIPIPLIGRFPLEAPLLHIFPTTLPPEVFPPSYFNYYGENIFLTSDEYRDRRSPRLIENKNAKLTQSEEIRWYMENLTDEDKKDLDPLLSQHKDALPDSVRAIIAIPANKEGTNIFHTLTQYSLQKDLRGNNLDPSTYQIVIYDNRTADTQPDNTKEEVMRFKAEHPDMNIVYLEQIFEERQTIGRYRRNLSNFVMKQLENRPADLPETIIISNDGDTVKLPQTYISTIVETFSTNQTIDAVTGRYDFPAEAYRNFPVLFATERAWQLMDAIVRHNEQSAIPQLMGANSALRAGSLAAIGGYNPKSSLGEDLEIGWMLQAARGGDAKRFLFLNALKLETDPRRALYKYIEGAGLLDRYTDFADNSNIRGMSWQEIATRAQEGYSREKLQENLTRLRNELYPWLKNSNPEGLDRYFKRSMEFLGVTYEIKDDKVIILDDSVLKAGINADMPIEQIETINERERQTIATS